MAVELRPWEIVWKGDLSMGQYKTLYSEQSESLVFQSNQNLLIYLVVTFKSQLRQEIKGYEAVSL